MPRPKQFLRSPLLRLVTRLLVLVFVGALSLSRSGEALAAPPGASGSASASTGGASASGRSSGFQLPDFVYGGNAVSLLAPVQVGLTPRGYIPRGRIGLQYDRQLHRAHWVHLGVAALFDRGRWSDFRMDSCGLTGVGTCEKGTTAGMDLWLGYTYKIYIEKQPWIVPILRAGLAGGFWSYPQVGGTREQSRELSWMLGLQAGAGVRFFLFRELAIGLDLELRPGVVVHRERPAAAPEPDNQAAFILPLQILPLIVEWRF
ncbi:MAG: hypothetical protein R6X02_21860 [Enhygromyxa sp.]